MLSDESFSSEKSISPRVQKLAVIKIFLDIPFKSCQWLEMFCFKKFVSSILTVSMFSAQEVLSL